MMISENPSEFKSQRFDWKTQPLKESNHDFSSFSNKNGPSVTDILSGETKTVFSKEMGPSSMDHNSSNNGYGQFKFKFSTYQQLGGLSCFSKFLVYFLFILLISILPILYIVYKETGYEGLSGFDEQWFAAVYLIYIPLGATFILFLIGQVFAGVLAYPYSNSLLNSG